MEKNHINPVTRLDYPDPDVIRVDDTYYMVSTTMHFMPGCEIRHPLTAIISVIIQHITAGKLSCQGIRRKTGFDSSPTVF